MILWRLPIFQPGQSSCGEAETLSYHNSQSTYISKCCRESLVLCSACCHWADHGCSIHQKPQYIILWVSTGIYCFIFSSGIWDISLQCEWWFLCVCGGRGVGILWMPCRDDFFILTRSVPFTSLSAVPMEPFKYIKIMHIYSPLTLGLIVFNRYMYSSKMWWGRSNLLSMDWWMRLRLVLVAAQKYTGIYYQPICSTDGTTNCWGCLVDWVSRTKNYTFRLLMPESSRIHPTDQPWWAWRSYMFQPSWCRGGGGKKNYRYPWTMHLVPISILSHLPLLG